MPGSRFSNPKANGVRKEEDIPWQELAGGYHYTDQHIWDMTFQDLGKNIPFLLKVWQIVSLAF